MAQETRSVCTIHGDSPYLWCTSCDQGANVERDLFTGAEVSKEMKRERIIDTLRSAGLSVDQVNLVMRTLESGEAGVSDEQLSRVLASVQGSRVSAPQQAPTPAETPADAAAALREAGWSEDRIAQVVKGA